MEFNFISKYTPKALSDLFDSFVYIHYVESGSRKYTIYSGIFKLSTVILPIILCSPANKCF